MLARTNKIEAGGIAPPAEVKVWDPFVRLFHWSLVALFIAAYATGDEWEGAHIAIGYAIAGLLAMRMIWGFVGTRRARFSDFVRGPGAVIGYLRELVAGNAKRYLGHNPAGGAMIVALILSLGLTALTGHLMTTKAMWGSKILEEVHEAFAHSSLALIGLHVAGVIVASIAHNENLVRAMLTGRKRGGD